MSHLQDTEITYQQRQYRDNPAFGLFRMHTPAQIGVDNTLVLAAPAETPLLHSNDRFEINTPIKYTGPLDFLGLRVI